jgi:hypothetical protein
MRLSNPAQLVLLIALSWPEFAAAQRFGGGSVRFANRAPGAAHQRPHPVQRPAAPAFQQPPRIHQPIQNNPGVSHVQLPIQDHSAFPQSQLHQQHPPVFPQAEQLIQQHPALPRTHDPQQTGPLREAIQNRPSQLPAGWAEANVDGRRYYRKGNYWYAPRLAGGVTYYDQVVDPNAQYVYELPANATAMYVSGVLYYYASGTYYQPQSMNGQQVYVIVAAPQ